MAAMEGAQWIRGVHKIKSHLTESDSNSEEMNKAIRGNSAADAVALEAEDLHSKASIEVQNAVKKRN